MIIQSETIMSVIDSFEKISNRYDDDASKFLASALKTASEENRTELLYSERNEYELLTERADAVKEALQEVKLQIQNNNV